MTASRVVGLAAFGVLTLCACSVPIPEPSVTPSLVRTGGMLDPQSERILEHTFSRLDAADAAANPGSLEGRVSDPAATARAAEYVLAANGGAKPDVISQEILALYTTDSEEWPRVMVGVVDAADSAHTPVVLMWVSDEAQDEFELRAWAHMIPGGVLPAMAPEETGAETLAMDAEGFVLTPAAAVEAYVALLNAGSTPETEAAFAADPYRTSMFAGRTALSGSAAGRGGTYKETVTAMTDEAFVLADLEGGALVFLPVEVTSDFNVPGAQLTLPAPDKALLTGKLGSRVVHRYEDLIVIRVPKAGTGLLPAVVAGDHHLVSVATS
jgi:hypothetical protein